MSYASGSYGAAPAMVNLYSGWCEEDWGPKTAPSSGTWESANRAVYFAILVPSQVTVRRVWWANGSSVSASYNIDAGVYADAGAKPGARLVSCGSTAQGTASSVQFASVTSTVIAPGRYWIAIACSSTSATFLRSTTVASLATDAAARFEEASALPLPATATPVESSNANAYLFGFATTASP